jgi:hypothetical protein
MAVTRIHARAAIKAAGPETAFARWLQSAERDSRGWLVEIPAALLVVAEIVILFAGVVARYVLPPAAGLVGRTGLDPVPLARHARRRGGVPARRAHAHDRGGRQVSAGRCGPSRCARGDRGARLPAADRPWPSYDYAYEESFITTPALEISECLARRGIADRHRPDALFALLRLVLSGKKQDCSALARGPGAAIIAASGSAGRLLKPLGNST